MSKIKKIILIIVSFFAFIIALCLIVDILDYKDNENTAKSDEAEMSKRAELLRKNTLTFEGLFFTRIFNLDYVQNLEGPVKYVDRNGNTNNVFTINFDLLIDFNISWIKSSRHSEGTSSL